MINVLIDGFSSFQLHFWIVICILLTLLWGQLVMRNIIPFFFDDSLTQFDFFSLSLAGWVFPVLTWSIIYLLINFLFGKIAGVVISSVLLLLPLYWIRLKPPSYLVIGLILFLLTSIFVRLAFLQQALLPAYFDSAEHYLNIQQIINTYESKTFSIFRSNYYHLGYHFLSAALIHLFQFNITDFMLVFGQIFLAVLPISLFFLLKQMTGSNIVAFFTSIVAGFGFHMPAHLINWGKYPALLSLFGIQFILCLGYLVVQKDFPQDKKIKLYWLISFSVLGTALIHTRTLIIFALFAFAYLSSLLHKRLPTQFQYLVFGFILFAVGVEVFYIQQSPVLSLLFERYVQSDIWILILLLPLFLFSNKTYPNLTFFLTVTIALIIFFLFFPIQLLDYGTLTLLDRPYAQMLIYLPFSILAGLGFAGFIKTLQNFSNSKVLIYTSSFVLFGSLLLNINFNQNFYPSDCCQLVSRDDLTAIEWIQKNIATSDKILIAATQLYVTSYERSSAKAPVDAGIWITPLTSRETPVQLTTMDFANNETLKFFCTENVRYIYLGSMPTSFKQAQLASEPSWYQPVFILPKAQIYQVVGCD